MKFKLFIIKHRLVSILLAIAILVSAVAPTMSLALALVNDMSWDGSVASKYEVGSGTVSDPYVITNADELALLAKTALEDGASTADKYYKLGADIVLNESLNENSRVWSLSVQRYI